MCMLTIDLKKVLDCYMSFFNTLLFELCFLLCLLIGLCHGSKLFLIQLL